jgi:hypothetical protein
MGGDPLETKPGRGSLFSKACAVPAARLDRKPLIRNTFLPIIAIGGGFCYDEKRHYMA